uniref:CARD domain-containing protein n=1 Tax=Lates calcarifer TaxID=8187 RepID=A0A4W6CY94_LATCA
MSVMDKLKSHKVELIDCLSADHSFILQHVDAKDIVTRIQYQNLMSIPSPGETVTKLIDQIINKGPKSCSHFVELLKDPELHNTYPLLREITEHCSNPPPPYHTTLYIISGYNLLYYNLLLISI